MIQALFLRPEAWKHARGNKQVTKGKEIIMDKGNNYRPNGVFFKAFRGAAAIVAACGLGSLTAFGNEGESFSYDFKTEKISFDGTSSGIFLGPTGAANLVSSGVGKSSFSWGLGVASPANSLSFLSKTLDGAVANTPFSIGTLSYFNGSVLNGTEAYSVGLRTKLNFSGHTESFDYGFKLINTPNTGSAPQNADYVMLSSSIPSSSFTIDGIDYALNLAFGSVTGGGFSQVNRFFVLEGGSASADLVGSITVKTTQTGPPTNPPAVVPEPSTILAGISAGGLILAFLVRRSRNPTLQGVPA
jgi:hypothetical protein